MKNLNFICILVTFCVVLTSSFSINSDTRYKRDSRPIYYVDVLVVADYNIYYRFYQETTSTNSISKDIEAVKNINEYFGLLMKSVNTIYENLKSNKLRLVVSLVDVVILKTDASSPWSVGLSSASTDEVLRTFKTWVDTNRNLPMNDHAMLFTDFDMISLDEERVVGRALKGSMCVDAISSVSVVRDSGGFQSSHTAAHELGHSLGANHDTGDLGCSWSEQYIMAANTSGYITNPLNAWLFSVCSKVEMETHVEGVINRGKSSERSCFLNKLPVSPTLPILTNQHAGQLYSPDEQCRQVLGPQSYYCRNPSLMEGGFTLCTSLPCYVPSSDKCIYQGGVKAAEGTTCGNQKWCQLGRCIYSPQAPATSDTCVHNSQPQLRISIITGGVKNDVIESCTELIRTRPHLCYQGDIRAICCGDCLKIRTQSSVCEYGNKMPGCQEAGCKRIYSDGYIYDQNCCGTCGLTSPFVCMDQDAEYCSMEISSSGQLKCYDSSFAFKCCQSCASLRHTANKGCEYGNRYPEEVCQQLIGTDDLTGCETYSRECCSTCKVDIPSTSSHNPLCSNCNGTSVGKDVNSASGLKSHIYMFILLFVTVYLLTQKS